MLRITTVIIITLSCYFTSFRGNYSLVQRVFQAENLVIINGLTSNESVMLILRYLQISISEAIKKC